MTSYSGVSVQLRIKTDASQFELKKNEGEEGEGLGAADDTISSQAMDVSQVLKDDKEDHVISTDAAVEPEGGHGSDPLVVIILYYFLAASSVEPPVCCPCGCNEVSIMLLGTAG